MYLGDRTKDEIAALLQRRLVAIVPVGSVEPHGPHLPLATDTLISLRAAELACAKLAAAGTTALIAPSVPYGVTDFATGFPGAVSIGADVLSAFLREVATALLRAGFEHVSLVNNHLEPEHDRAVRAALATLEPGRASVACPLTRRWARTLSAEFKSGACHAGRYETSLVLAARKDLVRRDLAEGLVEVPISLSDGIGKGLHTFAEMGISDAYAGAPALASEDEGLDLYEKLADMIAGEITEGLATLARARGV